MYQQFFAMQDRPFHAAPIAKRYLGLGAIEAARVSLARTIDRAEGIALLIGPAGTGKTMLCNVLADQFRSRMAVVQLVSSRLCTRRHFFQAIMHDLGLNYRGMEEGEMALAIADFATENPARPQGLLLILDEAHTLPGRLLEEARLLTNITRGGQSRVRLMLAGAAALEERLASPKLESFNQRVATRAYLQSLSHDETLDYIRGAIHMAGGDWQRVFTHDALTAVHRATDGIPRLINQVCDHALMLALAGGVKQIDKAGIEEAWADLQQLPTPWNVTGGAPEQSRDIIEFGSLDDDMPIAAKIGVAAPALAAATLAAESSFDVDELDLFSGEPSQRLDKIEARLEALDQPVEKSAAVQLPSKPKILPPVRPAALASEFNPAAEAFDDEEIVIDRFAGAGVDIFAGRPQVQSAAGREMWNLLAPLASGADELSVERAPSAQRHAASDDTASHAAITIAMPQPLADDPVMPEDMADFIADVAEHHSPDAGVIETIDLDALEHAAHVETQYTSAIGAVLGAGGPMVAAADSDADLIVIEDDLPTNVIPPAPAVRRQEYRQLFARLRRREGAPA